jgi:hypothetical protein
MKQEDKDLLYRYLCMVLPYKVKVCLYEKETCILLGIDGHEVYLDVDSDSFRIESIKPYLRPMSSMTEEEETEFDGFCVIDEFAWKGNSEIGYKNQAIIMSNAIEWLLKKHFDFMDLIPKGLAIAITEENNPYKTRKG